MSNRKRKAAVGVGWVVGLGFLFAIPISYLGLSSSEKPITARSETKTVLDVEFDKFRQTLIRTNATAAIVAHGGMNLVEDRLDALKIDLSKDSRPLRNAFAGKSKAEVFATKTLVVELDDPQLSTKRLSLDQDVKILLGSIHVFTKSSEPAGELLSYITTLDAIKMDQQTEITLSVEITIGVRVSPIFLSQAEIRVQNGADQAVLDQAKAIRNLISNFDNGSGK